MHYVDYTLLSLVDKSHLFALESRDSLILIAFTDLRSVIGIATVISDLQKELTTKFFKDPGILASRLFLPVVVMKHVFSKCGVDQVLQNK